MATPGCPAPHVARQLRLANTHRATAPIARRNSIRLRIRAKCSVILTPAHVSLLIVYLLGVAHRSADGLARRAHVVPRPFRRGDRSRGVACVVARIAAVRAPVHW